MLRPSTNTKKASGWFRTAHRRMQWVTMRRSTISTMTWLRTFLSLDGEGHFTLLHESLERASRRRLLAMSVICRTRSGSAPGWWCHPQYAESARGAPHRAKGDGSRIGDLEFLRVSHGRGRPAGHLHPDVLYPRPQTELAQTELAQSGLAHTML